MTSGRAEYRFQSCKAEVDRESVGEMNSSSTGPVPIGTAIGTARQRIDKIGDYMLRPSSSSGLITAADDDESG